MHKMNNEYTKNKILCVYYHFLKEMHKIKKVMCKTMSVRNTKYLKSGIVCCDLSSTFDVYCFDSTYFLKNPEA